MYRRPRGRIKGGHLCFSKLVSWVFKIIKAKESSFYNGEEGSKIEVGFEGEEEEEDDKEEGSWLGHQGEGSVSNISLV